MKLKIKRLKGKYVKKKLVSYGRKIKEKKSLNRNVLFKTFTYWILLILTKADILHVLKLREEDIIRGGLHLDQKLILLIDPFKLCCDMSKGEFSQHRERELRHSWASLNWSRYFMLCFGHPLILNSHNRAHGLIQYPLMNSRKSESWAATTTTNCFSIKSPSYNLKIYLSKKIFF